MQVSKRLLSGFGLALLLTSGRPAAANNNVLMNGAFVAGVASWPAGADPAFAVSWSPDIGDAAPGSLEVVTSNHVASDVAHQCANVLPNTIYGFGVSFRISSELSGRPNGSMTATWSTGSCGSAGSAIRKDQTPLSPFAPDAWYAVSNVVVSPANAKSVSLGLHMDDTSYGSLVYFDDAYLHGFGFLKGDANGDAFVDAADIFYLLNTLFAAGPLPYGPVDVNDDGVVDVSDAFYLLNYLFSNGPAPK